MKAKILTNYYNLFKFVNIYIRACVFKILIDMFANLISIYQHICFLCFEKTYIRCHIILYIYKVK